MGTVEAETDEQAPLSSETLPVDSQGAAEGAPLEASGSVEASAPAEPDAEPEGVTTGTSPSAPSRPARTRGKRGGKDSINKDYRRVFYQGFEQLKTFLGDHIRPRHGRPGFVLQWIDFEKAPSRLQELLINWAYFRSSASIQQLLCEAEYLIPQFARHVDQFGYNGEGSKLAEHVRRKTPTIESLYTDEPFEQRTYSEAWLTWGQDPVQDPIRRRVGAKSKAAGGVGSRGAASSAPDRSTSVGSWIGRNYYHPLKRVKVRVRTLHQEHPNSGSRHLGFLHQRFFL